MAKGTKLNKQTYTQNKLVARDVVIDSFTKENHINSKRQDAISRVKFILSIVDNQLICNQLQCPLYLLNIS